MSEDELPEGWIAAALGEVADVQLGKMLDRAKRIKGKHLPYLRNASVRWGAFDLSDLLTMPFESDELERYSVQLGDLLVCEGGEPGRAAVWGGGVSNIKYQKAILRVRPGRAISDPRWIMYSLRHDALSGNLEQHFTGSTIKHFPRQAVLQYEVRIPPLVEQKRIVATVEQQLARVNTAGERLARASKVLKQFRRAVLAAGCLGKLTAEWRTRCSFEPVENLLKRIKVRRSSTGRKATDDVIPGQCALSVGDPGTPCPETWRWVQLCDVARLESGHTPSRKHPEYWRGSTCWIGLHDAREKHGGVITATRQHVAEVGLENSAARLLPTGTVCLSRTASVGYVVIMGRPMATSQDFVNWVCSEALVPRFLMYSLMAEGGGIKQFGRGTTHTTIYFPEVKALHISLPPVQEQHEIVRRVDALLKAADLLEEHVAVATARVKRLTQAILAKAFRGELVPTEAELARREGRAYEPAVVLLSRVSAALTNRAPGHRAKGTRPSSP